MNKIFNNALLIIDLKGPKKVLALFLSLTVFYSDVLAAHAPEASFWTERRRSLAVHEQSSADVVGFPSTVHLQEMLKRPELLSGSDPRQDKISADSPASEVLKALDQIPYHLGDVRSHRFPAGRVRGVILHVQDVHLNNEAQKNIAGVLDYLGDAPGLIALEGAFAPLPLSRFRNFPEREIVDAVADYYFQEGTITGPVHWALTTRKNIPALVGVDDAWHHKANVQASLDARKVIAAVRPRLANYMEDLTRRKESVYSPALREFDRRMNDYAEKKVSLARHVECLAEESSGLSSNLQRFLEALHSEARLDYQKVDAERNKILEILVRRLSEKDMAEIVQQSLAYRLGKISYAAFYGYLTVLAQNHDINLGQFRNFEEYVRYVDLADKIDAALLFSEIKGLEEKGYQRLARTADEKRLVREWRAAQLASRLLDFALTPEEWGEYQSHREALGGLAGDMGVFEKFYVEAEARDGIMARGVEEAAKSRHSKLTVLVAGGFHSKGLEKKLADAGYAVVGFTPRISKLDNASGSAYLSVFAREKTPLEKIFQGEKLFVSPLIFPPYLRRAGFGLVGAAVSVLRRSKTSAQDVQKALSDVTANSLTVARGRGSRAVVFARLAGHPVELTVDGEAVPVSDDPARVVVKKVVDVPFGGARAAAQRLGGALKSLTLAQGWLFKEEQYQAFSLAMTLASIAMILSTPLALPDHIQILFIFASGLGGLLPKAQQWVYDLHAGLMNQPWSLLRRYGVTPSQYAAYLFRRYFSFGLFTLLAFALTSHLVVSILPGPGGIILGLALGWISGHSAGTILHETHNRLDKLFPIPASAAAERPGIRLAQLATVVSRRLAQGSDLLSEEDYWGLDLDAFLARAENQYPSDSEIRLDTYINNQAKYLEQAAVEGIANALDASAPGKTLGRFGVGGWQILAELQKPSDRVLHQSSQDGRFGIRFTFWRSGKDILFLHELLVPRDLLFDGNQPKIFSSADVAALGTEPRIAALIGEKGLAELRDAAKTGAAVSGQTIAEQIRANNPAVVLYGGTIQKGTSLSVVKNYSSRQVTERRNFIRQKFRLNTRGPLLWENGTPINTPEKLEYLNGTRGGTIEPGVPEVRVAVTRAGMSIVDHGSGMGLKHYVENFLKPKKTTKRSEGENQRTMEAETRAFYNPALASRSRLSIWLTGREVESHEIGSDLNHSRIGPRLNLVAEAAFELPHDSDISEDWSRLNLVPASGDSQAPAIVGMKRMIDKLVDPGRTVKNRFGLINALTALLAIKQSAREKGLVRDNLDAATDLIWYMRERLNEAGGLLEQERNAGRTFIPNLPTWGRFMGREDVVLLDPALFDFSLENIERLDFLEDATQSPIFSSLQPLGARIFLGNFGDARHSDSPVVAQTWIGDAPVFVVDRAFTDDDPEILILRLRHGFRQLAAERSQQVGAPSNGTSVVNVSRPVSLRAAARTNRRSKMLAVAAALSMTVLLLVSVVFFSLRPSSGAVPTPMASFGSTPTSSAIPSPTVLLPTPTPTKTIIKLKASLALPPSVGEEGLNGMDYVDSNPKPRPRLNPTAANVEPHGVYGHVEDPITGPLTGPWIESMYTQLTPDGYWSGDLINTSLSELSSVKWDLTTLIADFYIPKSSKPYPLKLYHTLDTGIVGVHAVDANGQSVHITAPFANGLLQDNTVFLPAGFSGNIHVVWGVALREAVMGDPRGANTTIKRTQTFYVPPHADGRYPIRLYQAPGGKIRFKDVEVKDMNGQKVDFGASLDSNDDVIDGAILLWTDAAGLMTVSWNERHDEPSHGDIFPYSEVPTNEVMDFPQAWSDAFNDAWGRQLDSLAVIKSLMTNDFTYDPANAARFNGQSWGSVAQSYLKDGKKIPVDDDTAVVFAYLMARHAGYEAANAQLAPVKDGLLYSNLSSQSAMVVTTPDGRQIFIPAEYIPNAKPPEWIAPTPLPVEFHRAIPQEFSNDGVLVWPGPFGSQPVPVGPAQPPPAGTSDKRLAYGSVDGLGQTDLFLATALYPRLSRSGEWETDPGLKIETNPGSIGGSRKEVHVKLLLSKLYTAQSDGQYVIRPPAILGGRVIKTSYSTGQGVIDSPDEIARVDGSFGGVLDIWWTFETDLHSDDPSAIKWNLVSNQEPMVQEFNNLPESWQRKLEQVRGSNQNDQSSTIETILRNYFIVDPSHAIDYGHLNGGVAQQYVRDRKKIPVSPDTLNAYAFIMLRYLGYEVYCARGQRVSFADNNLYVNRATDTQLWVHWKTTGIDWGWFNATSYTPVKEEPVEWFTSSAPQSQPAPSQTTNTQWTVPSEDPSSINTQPRPFPALQDPNAPKLQYGQVQGPLDNPLITGIYPHMSGDGQWRQADDLRLTPEGEKRPEKNNITAEYNVPAGQTRVIDLPQFLDGEILGVTAVDGNNKDVFVSNDRPRGSVTVRGSDSPITVTWVIQRYQENRSLSYQLTPLPENERNNLPKSWADILNAVKGGTDEEKMAAIAGIMQKDFAYDNDKSVQRTEPTWGQTAQKFLDRGERIPIICDTSSVYFYILARYVDLPAAYILVENTYEGGLYLNLVGHAEVVVKVNGRWQIVETTALMPLVQPAPTWLAGSSDKTTRPEVGTGGKVGPGPTAPNIRNSSNRFLDLTGPYQFFKYWFFDYPDQQVWKALERQNQDVQGMPASRMYVPLLASLLRAIFVIPGAAILVLILWGIVKSVISFGKAVRGLLRLLKRLALAIIAGERNARTKGYRTVAAGVFNAIKRPIVYSYIKLRDYAALQATRLVWRVTARARYRSFMESFGVPDVIGPDHALWEIPWRSPVDWKARVRYPTRWGLLSSESYGLVIQVRRGHESILPYEIDGQQVRLLRLLARDENGLWFEGEYRRWIFFSRRVVLRADADGLHKIQSLRGAVLQYEKAGDKTLLVTRTRNRLLNIFSRPVDLFLLEPSGLREIPLEAGVQPLDAHIVGGSPASRPKLAFIQRGSDENFLVIQDLDATAPINPSMWLELPKKSTRKRIVTAIVVFALMVLSDGYISAYFESHHLWFQGYSLLEFILSMLAITIFAITAIIKIIFDTVPIEQWAVVEHRGGDFHLALIEKAWTRRLHYIRKFRRETTRRVHFLTGYPVAGLKIHFFRNDADRPVIEVNGEDKTRFIDILSNEKEIATGDVQFFLGEAAGMQWLVDGDGWIFVDAASTGERVATYPGSIRQWPNPNLLLPFPPIEHEGITYLLIVRNENDELLAFSQGEFNALPVPARLGTPSATAAAVTELPRTVFRAWDDCLLDSQLGLAGRSKSNLDSSALDSWPSPVTPDVSIKDAATWILAHPPMNMELKAELLHPKNLAAIERYRHVFHLLDQRAMSALAARGPRMEFFSLAVLFMDPMTDTNVLLARFEPFVARLDAIAEAALTGNLAAARNYPDGPQEWLRGVFAILPILLSFDNSQSNKWVNGYLDILDADSGFALALANRLMTPVTVAGQSEPVMPLSLLFADEQKWKTLPPVTQFFIKLLRDGVENLLKEEEDPAPSGRPRNSLAPRGQSLARLVQAAGSFSQAEIAEGGLERVTAAHRAAVGADTSDIAGAVINQETVLPVWIRELVQNSRDAIRAARRTSNKPVRNDIQIRSFLNRGRWVVSVRDFVGMPLDVLLKKAVTPDATTKSLVEEIFSLLDSKLPPEQLTDRLLNAAFRDEAAGDSAVRTKLLELVTSNSDMRTLADAIVDQFESKLKKSQSGFFGQGLFTVFSDADQVLIRSGYDGLLHEILMEPVRNAANLVVDIRVVHLRSYGDRRGQFQGTEVQRIKRVTAENVGRMAIENAFLRFQAFKFLGAMTSVNVTWQGEALGGRVRVMGHQGPLQAVLTEDGFERIALDELHIEDPSEPFFSAVPAALRTPLLAAGLNLDFEAGTPVVRTRNALQNPEQYSRWIGILALQTYAGLYRAGRVQPQGFPSAAAYFSESPWSADWGNADLRRDAALINAGLVYGNGADARSFWRRFEADYLSDPIQWTQLMFLVAFPREGGVTDSLNTERMNAYAAALPDGLVRTLNDAAAQEHRYPIEPVTDSPGSLEFRRMVLYEHLVAAAALFEEGHVRLNGKTFGEMLEAGEVFPENPDLDAMAARINEKDFSALDGFDGSSWEDLAVRLRLSENGDTVQAKLQRAREALARQAAERERILRDAQKRQAMTESSAAAAIQFLAELLLEATQTPFAASTALRLADFLPSLRALVNENRVEPLAETVLSLTGSSDAQTRAAEFFDNWLKSGVTKQEIIRQLLEAFEPEELAVSTTALQQDLATHPQVSVSLARGRSSRLHAVGGEILLAAVLMGGISHAAGVTGWPLAILLGAAGLAAVWSGMLFLGGALVIGIPMLIDWISNVRENFHRPKVRPAAQRLARAVAILTVAGSLAATGATGRAALVADMQGRVQAVGVEQLADLAKRPLEFLRTSAADVSEDELANALPAAFKEIQTSPPRTGRDALEAIEGAVMALEAKEPAAAQTSAFTQGQTSFGIIVVNERTAPSLPARLKAYAGKPVLLAVTNPALRSAAEAAASNSESLAVVRESERILISRKDSAGAISMTALDGMFRDAINSPRIRSSIQGEISVVLTVPRGTELDFSGLPDNSPLARAVLIIGDIFRDLKVERRDFDLFMRASKAILEAA